MSFNLGAIYNYKQNIIVRGEALDQNVNSNPDTQLNFFKRFIAQKIQRDTQRYKTVPLINLP